MVGVASLLLLFYTNRSLEAYYLEPKYARDDYRSLVQYVVSQSISGDAVVLNAPGQVEIFEYYYRRQPRQDAAIYPLPSPPPAEPLRTGSQLAELKRYHPRVWLVLWAANESDPQKIVEGWLQEHGRILAADEFGNIDLRLYALEDGR